MCIFSSGKPKGVGILERGVYGEGDGRGEISYEQPGTKMDRILTQQGGFQVSKRKLSVGEKYAYSGYSNLQYSYDNILLCG
jgi:hypothetical protein